MVLHTSGPTSGFDIIHIVEEKNDIAHLQAYKGFFNSHVKRNEMILHICELANGFFYSHR
jgi:hypothetical protein